jgi:hypothetical protein
MRSPLLSGYAIAGYMALALVAGCAYRGIAPEPVSMQNVRPFSELRLVSKAAQVVVSDSQNGVVNFYLQQAPHTLVAQLTGFAEPQGMAVDIDGNLYVANTGGADVLVFAPGAKSPFLKLDDSGNLPVGVAVDADGTVFVSNIRKADSSKSTGILVYQKGATKPSRKLSDPSIYSNYFVAIGPNHSVYTDYFDQNGVAQVGYYTGKSLPLHNLNIPNFQFPGGLKIDDGNVLVIDQNARALLIYKPPHRYPRSFIPFIGAGDPVNFDFGDTEKSVWVADGNGTAEHYAPSGRLIDSIPVGGVPIGIVTLPQR